MVVYLKDRVECQIWHNFVMKMGERLPLEVHEYSEHKIFNPIYYKDIKQTKEEIKQRINEPPKSFYSHL